VNGTLLPSHVAVSSSPPLGVIPRRHARRSARSVFGSGAPALLKEAPRLVKEASRLVKEAPRLGSDPLVLLGLRLVLRSAPRRRRRHDGTLGRPAQDPRSTCSSLGSDRPFLVKLRPFLVKLRQVPRTGALPLLSACQFLLGTCSLLGSDRSALVKLRHFLVKVRQTAQKRL
jgi:hypothetical protein